MKPASFPSNNRRMARPSLPAWIVSAATLRRHPAVLVALATLSGPLPAATADNPSPSAAPDSVRNLFNGRDLTGWKPSDFDSQTPVKVVNPFRDGPGAIVLTRSSYMAGITWTKEAELPRMNYEISLEAMKTEGTDFFCGLTFPVGDSAVTFVVGGWGGMVVGISCIDNSDASDNETSGAKEFLPNRWYRIRVRVTPGRLDAWIDDEQMVEFETTGRRLDLRFGDIKNSLPLGIAAYETGAALRNIQLRRL